MSHPLTVKVKHTGPPNEAVHGKQRLVLSIVFSNLSSSWLGANNMSSLHNITLMHECRATIWPETNRHTLHVFHLHCLSADLSEWDKIFISLSQDRPKPLWGPKQNLICLSPTSVDTTYRCLLVICTPTVNKLIYFFLAVITYTLVKLVMSN